jgi:hypothetical protein
MFPRPYVRGMPPVRKPTYAPRVPCGQGVRGVKPVHCYIFSLSALPPSLPTFVDLIRHVLAHPTAKAEPPPGQTSERIWNNMYISVFF